MTRLFLSFFVLIFLNVPLVGEPKSLEEKAETPKRKLVVLCYTGGASVSRACDHVRRRIAKNCEPSIELVDIKDKEGRPLNNPTPEQVKESLARDNLPRHTPVMVLGHAILDYKADPKDKDKVITTHSLSGSRGTIDTEDLLSKVREELDSPSIWMMACHAGLACNKGCVGGACGAKETVEFGEAFGLKMPGTTSMTMSNPQTNHILDLLCSKEKFDKADQGDPLVKGDAREKDGILDADELRASMCTLPESRRYFDFYMPTHRDGDAGIERVSAEDRKKIELGYLKEIKETLEHEMGKDMTSQWKWWTRQRTKFEKEMSTAKSLLSEIADIRTKLAEAEKASDAKPDDDDLRNAYNKLVRKLNFSVDDYNRRTSNMGVSGENHALFSRWQISQDQYGSVKQVMEGLVREVDRSEYTSYRTERDPESGKPVVKPANYRIRYTLPEPRTKKQCIWTSRDAFATPELAKYRLHFAPSTARPKGKRTEPAESGGSTTDESHTDSDR